MVTLVEGQICLFLALKVKQSTLLLPGGRWELFLYWFLFLVGHSLDRGHGRRNTLLTVLSAAAVSKVPWSLVVSIKLNSSEPDWVCWVCEECSFSSLSKRCMLAIFSSVQVNSALPCLCCCFFCCCPTSSSAASFSLCCSVNSWSICVQSRDSMTEAALPHKIAIETLCSRNWWDDFSYVTIEIRLPKSLKNTLPSFLTHNSMCLDGNGNEVVCGFKVGVLVLLALLRTCCHHSGLPRCQLSVRGG